MDIFKKNTLTLVFSVFMTLLVGCAALETMLYGGAGAAAGSLAGPGGAAGGAVIGVGAAKLRQGQECLDGMAATTPLTPWESFIDSASNLLHTVGWWYLILFIFVPLITKRGRTWAKNFISLSDTATKKDVDEYSTRLNKLEEELSSAKEQEQ